MFEQNLNEKEPPYIAHYSLACDPFSQKVENDLFYAEPVRKQRLDILLHLAQYGNELMIVVGPKGSGKTSLLQQFKAKSQDTWTVACIEAEGGLDERKLLQQLYHQMDLEFVGATHTELLEQMKHHFDSLQRSARLGIMVIDNAEQLPITALRLVLEMASLANAENKPLLRIILFATEDLEAEFKDPLLAQFSSLPKRNMDLPPFSEEQTAHYILYRLSAAHYTATEPFTESAMLKLYRDSYGWPARINELAHDLLIKTLPKKSQQALPGFDTKTFHPIRLVAAVLTIVVVSTLLFFQNDINQWINPGKTASTSTKNVPLTLPESKLKSKTEITQALDETNSSTADSEPPSSSSMTNMPGVDKALVDKKIADKKSQPTGGASIKSSEKASAILRAQKRIREEKAAQDAAKIAKKIAVEKKNTTEKTVALQKPFGGDLNISRKEEWILKQKPDHYTMQMVAGEQIKTIEKFIWEHKLKNDIAFYRSVRRGKPWYGLIYGTYPNKQSAVNARGKLPGKLSRLKPWVRDFSGVHKDIHKPRP